MPHPAPLLVVSLLLSLAVSARAVVIVNPGFEDNVLPNPVVGQNDNFFAAFGEGASITAVPGWTFAGSQSAPFTSYAGISDLGVGNHTTDGLIDNNIAWFFIAAGRPTGTVRATQTLADTIQANTRYTLTLRVAQAARAEGDPNLANPLFPILGDGVSTGDVFARLYAGTAAKALPGFRSALSSVSVPAENEWVNWTLVWETGAFEPLAGTALGIELFHRADTQSLAVPVEVFFDDVALTATPVPEPGSMVFGLLTLLAGAGLRLRRER